jgi:hypothetical protein
MTETSLLPICSFISYLTLAENDERAIAHGLDEIRQLGPCPRLKELDLQMCCSTLDRHRSFFVTAFPSVTSLTIWVLPIGTISLRSVLDTISSIPTEQLGIFFDHDSFFTDEFPTEYEFPNRLHEIFFGHHTDNFFAGILSLAKVPIFSTIRTIDAWPGRGSQFAKYLCHIGDILRHLELHLHYSEIWDSASSVDLILNQN